MNTTLSRFEYDYLEDKAKIGLTIDEYEVIKHALVAEKIFKQYGVDMNSVDDNVRVIAKICSAFGFYIDQTGELSFSK